MASQASGIDYPYFADNDYAGYYGSNASSKYSTARDRWGHLNTYQYGSVPNENNWATYMGEGSKIHGADIWLNSSSLNHRLYKDNTQIYYATKYGSLNAVFEDYKKAYRYVHGTTPSHMNGVWGFCYWDGMDGVTFTLKSINDKGASLSSLMPDRQKTVTSGSSVSLSVGTIEGYTKTKWGDSTNSSTWTNNQSLTYSIPSLNSNLTKYAVYHRNSFKGQTAVYEGPNSTSANSSNTGLVSNDTTAKTLNINCDAGSCQASFYFRLKSVDIPGQTYYKIYRGNSILNGYKGASIVPSIHGQQVAHFTDTLTPGQTVCYTLEFKPYGDKSNNAYAKATACAKAAVSTFEGKSSVNSLAASDSTGWQNTNTTKTVDINDCSATYGCRVVFRHSLRRTTGVGSTNWHVARTSNLITSTKAIAPNPNIANGNCDPGPSTDYNNRENQVRVSEELRLYPGMIVCERLYFYPTSRSANSVSTSICASALGKAQPDDPDYPDAPEDPNYPSGDNSLINIKVRNQSVNAYHNFQREIYAKPGDELIYRASYNPVLQYTYGIIPQRMRINNGPIYPVNGRNNSAKLAAMFNLYKDASLKNWNNSFSVSANGFTMTPLNYTFTPGDTTKQSKTNNHTVTGSEVGTSLDEVARFNLNQYTQTTPTQVIFSDINNDNTANVITSSRSKTAFARVPYNFINTTEITKAPDDVIYAGEIANINFSVNVNPKKNSITDGHYSTIVRSAEWGLEVCFGGNCSLTSKDVGNKTGTLFPNSTNNKSVSLNVPDVPAGTEICVRSMVYPANSGTDTNWQDRAGSHTWAYSPQRCFKVAKRPHIQAWGGMLYSRGDISLTDTIKNNLANYTDYKIEGSTNKNYVFGSWTELGLVASGTVKGLSSGASLGFAANNNGNLWPGYHPADGNGNNQNIAGRAPGGSDKKSLCDRSPLTFANTCVNGLVGSIGSATAASNANDDKNTIISKFIFGGSINIGNPNNVTLNNEGNKREDTAIYYYYGGNSKLTLPGSTINKDTVQVVHSTNNITISGNLQYEDSYATLEDIPKLIIYTEKEIRVNCNVNRIDAVLIADSVLTCNNLSSTSGEDKITNDRIKARINDQVNSNQLKINGAIIAGKLYPNRTYGAATGANSMIPAEIINFDPSLYTWGTTVMTAASSGDSEGDKNLDTVYRKELPPRY